MKRTLLIISLLLLSLNSFALTYFLTDQWTRNGDNMCEYGNGTVLNVGYRICPLSIEG